MAHLGTIQCLNCATTKFSHKAPRFIATPRELLSAAKNGDISGTVTVGGSPVVGAEVVLFHRRSKMPLEQTISAANGTYTFSGLIQDASEYFVVAFYPEDTTEHNAIIFDKITPV